MSALETLPDPEVDSFARLLRGFRIAAGLTQDSLAERAGLGVRTLQDLERGVHRPRGETVQRVVRALDLTGDRRFQLERVTWIPRLQRAGEVSRRTRIPPRDVPEGPGVPPDLPIPLTSLVGRERETAVVAGLLDRCRLVTLTGPPGIGKTRLATRVAANRAGNFSGGVYFVPLASLGDPTMLLPAIARKLGLGVFPGRRAIDVLQAAIGARTILLVLDNFETVAAAAGPLSELLGACPGLHLLVASRVLLRVQAERVFDVGPLAVPDRLLPVNLERIAACESVRLFVERASAERADFALTGDNVLAVVEICVRLEGIPLAIELAAARTRLLSLQDLRVRLTPLLPFLASRASDRPERHRTMHNAIDWSYALLDRGEQTLFRRLGVFVGGCTVAAAAEVGADGTSSTDLLERLESLVNTSLLRREDVAGETRLGMLESIREYARELLDASAEQLLIRERHAAHFLKLVDDTVRLYSTDGSKLLDRDARLGPEEANLRAALAWCRDHDPERGLRLASGLGWQWVFGGDLTEGESWLETFLELARGESETRGRALIALATLKRDRGLLAEAQPLLEQGLSLCRQVGDQWGTARALVILAQQARSMADYERAASLARESLTIARAIRAFNGIIFALFTLSQVSRLRGDFASAREYLEDQFRLIPGDPLTLTDFGRTAEAEGDDVQAERYYRDALVGHQARSNARGAGYCRFRLGLLARRRGDRIEARRHIEEAHATLLNTHISYLVAQTLYTLAELDWQADDPVSAGARLTDGLTLAQQELNVQATALGLLVAARHATATGEFTRGLRLFGAAESVAPRFRFEHIIVDLVDYEGDLAVLRSEMPATQFAAVWAEGQAMTLDEAVTYALEEARES